MKRKRAVSASHQILTNRLAAIDDLLGRDLINDNTRADYEKARQNVVKALEVLPDVCSACDRPITSAASLAAHKGSTCRRKGAA
jgi:hypothetical protein